MINWLMRLFGWLFGIWEKFPDSAKEKIVEEVVEAFSKWFGNFYDEFKKNRGN